MVSLCLLKKYTQQQKQDFKELINGRNIAVVVVTAIGCYGIALLLSQIIGALVPGSHGNISGINWIFSEWQCFDSSLDSSDHRSDWRGIDLQRYYFQIA